MRQHALPISWSVIPEYVLNGICKGIFHANGLMPEDDENINASDLKVMKRRILFSYKNS